MIVLPLFVFICVAAADRKTCLEFETVGSSGNLGTVTAEFTNSISKTYNPGLVSNEEKWVFCYEYGTLQTFYVEAAGGKEWLGYIYVSRSYNIQTNGTVDHHNDGTNLGLYDDNYRQEQRFMCLDCEVKSGTTKPLTVYLVGIGSDTSIINSTEALENDVNVFCTGNRRCEFTLDTMKWEDCLVLDTETPGYFYYLTLSFKNLPERKENKYFSTIEQWKVCYPQGELISITAQGYNSNGWLGEMSIESNVYVPELRCLFNCYCPETSPTTLCPRSRELNFGITGSSHSHIGGTTRCPNGKECLIAVYDDCDE